MFLSNRIIIQENSVQILKIHFKHFKISFKIHMVWQQDYHLPNHNECLIYQCLDLNLEVLNQHLFYLLGFISQNQLIRESYWW